MQSLDIISVKLWQILISLCNLLLIFLLVKKFLFKPVKKMIAERQAAVNEQLDAATEDRKLAAAQKAEWGEKMSTADRAAEEIVENATITANRRSEAIVEKAKEKADGMLRQAETQIELDRQKAGAQIREEIVTISTALAEKMLEREINTDDHRQLISSFMQEIGEDNDQNC